MHTLKQIFAVPLGAEHRAWTIEKRCVFTEKAFLNYLFIGWTFPVNTQRSAMYRYYAHPVANRAIRSFNVEHPAVRVEAIRLVESK
jgi:hypothetical protein